MPPSMNKFFADPDRRYVLFMPYGLPEHGMVLHDREKEIVLLAAPVCASEDPALATWLAQGGVYLVIDHTGTHARVGEGDIAINRIRYHRTHPPLVPVWLTCVFHRTEPLSLAQRRYLETSVARRWEEEGSTLVSSHFQKKFPRLSETARARLDGTCDAAFDCMRIVDRILDRDFDGLEPLENAEDLLVGPPLLWRSAKPAPGPCRLIAEDGELLAAPDEEQRIDIRARQFLPGTMLSLETGRIAALALVRETHVELQPGSTIYLDTGKRLGRNVKKEVAGWVTGGKVRPVSPAIGLVMRPIEAASAASLARRVTAARRHNAAAWRVVRSPSA